MSEDNRRDEETTDAATDDEGEEVPVRVEREAPCDSERTTGDRRGGGGAVEQFDETIIDLLSWVLDTETRARIYVYLRQHPGSTSGEVAEGTGLYPSTVREALAALHGEEKVSRRKRESEGAGNNPYEYTAIAPSELVGGVIGQIQDELNTVFNLDKHLGRDREVESREAETGPVTINVDEEADVAAGGAEGTGSAGEPDVVKGPETADDTPDADERGDKEDGE